MWAVFASVTGSAKGRHRIATGYLRVRLVPGVPLVSIAPRLPFRLSGHFVILTGRVGLNSVQVIMLRAGSLSLWPNNLRTTGGSKHEHFSAVRWRLDG